MAGIASEVGKLLSVTGVWLIALLVPIGRSAQQWVNRRRDFDVVGSALVPSILFLVLFVMVLGGILAPRGGGLEALWIWAGFQSGTVFSAAVVIAIVAIAGGAGSLLFGGHRVLLAIWKVIPLPREPNQELPTVDRAGVVRAFEALRYQMKWAKPVVPGKQPGPIHQFLLQSLGRPIVPESFEGDPQKLDAVTTLSSNLAVFVEGCRTEADHIIEVANELAEGDYPPVVAGDDGAADEGESGKASSKDHDKEHKKTAATPDAKAMQRVVEDLLDGLSPRFVGKHQALVDNVEDFQKAVCRALAVIGEQIRNGAISFKSLPAVGALVDELDVVSRDLAWRLGQTFGVDDAHRVHANSLAFNLDSTTLGRWRYWRPLERYDWANGKEFGSSELINQASRDAKALKKLREAVKEVPEARDPLLRTRQWPSVGQAEKAKERAKAALKERLDRLQKDADELELLRAARSKIVTYTTLASVIIVIGLLAATLALGVMRTSEADWAIISVIVAWGGLVLAMYVAVTVFIYPVANHAFLLCIKENRKRLKAAAALPARTRPLSFDWAEPVRPVQGAVWSAGIVVGLALLPVAAHAVLVDRGITDYRLVVKSTRPLAKDDGITTRNLQDLVDVSWERCNRSWPENRLIDPTTLVDTYLVEDCAKPGSVFIKPDLVVRVGKAASSGANPAVAPAKGCINRFIDQYEQASSRAQAAIEAICRSTINKPKDSIPVVVPPPPPLVAVAPPPPGSPPPVTVTVPNVTTVEVNTGSVVLPPVEIRAPPPEIRVEPPAIYIVLPGRSDPPQPAQHIGSVKFNFDCSKVDDADHCFKGPPPKCDVGDRVDADSNETALKDIAGRIQTMGKNKNVVFVGWADLMGEQLYNKRLGEERARSVSGLVSKALKKAEGTSQNAVGAKPELPFEAISHVLGVGAGNPDHPQLKCEANRRRVDVYVIDAD
ncbi:MAG: hypothetical protein ISP49_14490 [Reyranella sp.]|nr:hypothetical protein [Reyranella sp.]